jgi:hypothetical protein
MSLFLVTKRHTGDFSCEGSENTMYRSSSLVARVNTPSYSRDRHVAAISGVHRGSCRNSPYEFAQMKEISDEEKAPVPNR